MREKNANKIYYVRTETMERNPRIVWWLKGGGKPPEPSSWIRYWKIPKCIS